MRWRIPPARVGLSHHRGAAMTRLALSAAIVLAFAGTAAAQPWFGPPLAPGFGGGFAYRSQFAVGPGGFRAGWWYSRNFYAAPIVPYTSIGWWPAYGPGYGPGYGNPFFLPPPGGAYPYP